MAKKKYKVDILSPSSIERLKNNLIDYQGEVQAKTWLLCQRLAEIGVEVAKANVVSLDAVFTGELFNGIHSEEVTSSNNKTVFSVIADNSHAIFVEFGTGLIGKESPYPGDFPEGVGWQYASGKTIRQLADGRYGWFYNRDGQWYFTEGMPSRPFMYFASMELQKQVVKIAKEVFG